MNCKHIVDAASILQLTAVEPAASHRRTRQSLCRACVLTPSLIPLLQPIADSLVKEVAKPAKDSLTEVIRSGDFLSYTAEEAVRFLGQGDLLLSDSFPGQDRNKLCLSQKVGDPKTPILLQGDLFCS